MSTIPEIPAEVVQAGLVYVVDAMAGIERRRAGQRFSYRNPDGTPVRDPETLARIRHLAIPPAYERVWICPLPNGHLQATGIDSKGRKQYRYHPHFREVRDEDKYHRMVDFGQALPEIRERIDADLAKTGLPREKVLAVIAYLLERSLIRVGNEEYAKLNHHFGLTTLRNRHVKIEGHHIRFHFMGKSGVQHDIELNDGRLSRAVKKIQGLPGQHLFQYIGEQGQTHAVTSADVNAYLDSLVEGHFTAKDFRTWAGTVLALTQLAEIEPAQTLAAAKRNVTSVVKVVAKQLGNTPAVCRKCYIHPAVVDAYSNGTLKKYLAKRADESPEAASELVDCAESVVLDLLRRHEIQAAKADRSKPTSVAQQLEASIKQAKKAAH